MNDHYEKEVSFILATHNRCAVTLRTLDQVAACGLDRRDYEIIVVDNASTDGTPEAVAPKCDRFIRLPRNAGSCAKAYGVDGGQSPPYGYHGVRGGHGSPAVERSRKLKRAAQLGARGRYIVFLDDDSHPRPGCVARMIEHFQNDPQLGATGFAVHLPDGRQEGGAWPNVFLGCGVGFRARALQESGGLDRSFFMQAEEYDLSFRLVRAGWRVRLFDDLHVEHLKTAQARKSARTTYYDIRNNLRVAARYLPAPYYGVYRTDWLQRYSWLARRDHHLRSYRRGARAGRWLGRLERWTFRRWRLAPDGMEQFFRWGYVRRQMMVLVEGGVRRIILADLGKNVYAYYGAARDADIEIPAIADDRFAAPGRFYRGLPVVTLDEALERRPDAVVVGNSSPVHGSVTYQRVAARVSLPVHHWFPAAPVGKRAEIDASSAPIPTDNPYSVMTADHA